MAPLKEVIDRWHNDFLRDDLLRKEVDRLRKELDPQFQEEGVRCPQCNANILDNIDSWREHVASDPQHQQKLSIESEVHDAYMRIYQAFRDATVQLYAEETVNVDASRNGPQRPAVPPSNPIRALSSPQSSQDDDSTSVMIPQPETRPISQDQLVAEVKGIYAGLTMVETKCIEVDNKQSSNELGFAVRITETVMRRWGDTNTLPFLHTLLVFVNHVTRFPAAISHIEGEFPWKLTALMLNSLLVSCAADYEIHSDFRLPERGQTPRPLPEDFAMRGLIYAEDYFPDEWFKNHKIDEDETYFELGSMAEERKDRILSLGRAIATSGSWLIWNPKARQFSVPAKYDVKLEDIPV
ncbi:hypothetical protein CDV36_014758 [Fusarium kuroshium]|uniref:Uncharacterized protein n=1 Tax=Fusarium kuroshium TaxID=2010991 RepID=A0A3M2REY0_9HYPO|nr:hypothetical protein CDV36_014758 [Fusarium kuroshium]